MNPEETYLTRAAFTRQTATQANRIILEALAGTPDLAALNFTYRDTGVTAIPNPGIQHAHKALDLLIEAFTGAGWGFHTLHSAPEYLERRGITFDAPHTLTLF